MDCSPPGSSVHEIFQARILEWVAISFSRGSPQPRDWTQVSCTAGRFFTNWAAREALILHVCRCDSSEWTLKWMNEEWMNGLPHLSASCWLKIQRGVLMFTESPALINPTNNSQLCSDNAHTHTQKQVGRKGKWWWRKPISWYLLCQQPKSSKKHSPEGPMYHLLFYAPTKALWSEAPRLFTLNHTWNIPGHHALAWRAPSFKALLTSQLFQKASLTCSKMWHLGWRQAHTNVHLSIN